MALNGNSLIAERLHIAYAAAGIGVHDYDVRSGTIRWDARVHELWGAPQTETIGYDSFMAGVHPDDREATQAAVDASLDPNGSGDYRAEYRVIDQATGVMRWIAATGQTFFEDGEPIRLVGTVQDVSAQRSTEARLRAVLDGMGEAFGLLAPDFSILEMNDQALALETRSRAEIIGKTHWEAFPGSEDSELGRLYKKAMNERVPVALDHRYEWEDGRSAWLDMRAYPLPDGNLAIFYRDVTERREVEQRLLVAESQFKSLCDNIRGVFYVLELDENRISFVSPAYERLWQQPVHELYADPAAFVRRIHEDDRQAVLDAIERQKRGEDTERHYRLRYDDGTERRIYDRAYVTVNPETGARRAVGIAEDITGSTRVAEQLRETTRRLDAVLENASVAIFLMDDRQHCAYMNRAAEELTGYTFAETQGRPLHDVVHHTYPDGRPFPMSECAIDRAFPENANTVGEEVFVHKDGSFYPVAFVASPIRDESSKTIGTIIEVRDIREEKAAAAALVLMNEELEARVAERTASLADAARALTEEMQRREAVQAQLVQAQKMEALGQLVGGVAHDFNNILAAIQSAFSLLKTRVDTDEKRAIVSEGSRAGERATALIRQMLAFARRQTVEPQTIDLTRVLPSLREMLCHAVGPTVDCRVEVERDVAPILADLHQLEVALLNLSVNARDALPLGGSLTISAANVADDVPKPAALGSTAAVVIRVTDTGLGMDAETVRRALEPFYTTKSIGQGTGLGLAQVHGFVTRASGALTIESEPGAGTTISMFFPRLALKAVEQPGQTEPGAIADMNIVVLLVDDDDQVRPLAATQLRDLGHTVIEASSGAVALTLAELHKVDVLVTDVAMPDMDGPSLSKRMRDRQPALPVIYVTGYAGGRNLDDGLVIEKPFRIDVLAQAIADAAAGAQTERPRRS